MLVVGFTGGADHHGATADRELHSEGADGAARPVDQDCVPRADGQLFQDTLGRLGRDRQRCSRLPGQTGRLAKDVVCRLWGANSPSVVLTWGVRRFVVILVRWCCGTHG
jgi:hypothetical protein